MNFLRVNEIAKLLKISRPLPYQWIKSGKLKHYKIGKLILVDEEDLRQFLEAHKKN